VDEDILKMPGTKKILIVLAGFAAMAFSYYLGMLLSRLVAGYLSPSVAGMIVLFLLLRIKVVKEEWIKIPATFFLDNLMLFFIPVTAGVALIPLAAFGKDAISLIIAATVSTWIVLWVTGKVAQKIDKS
jgi:holin-like protein